jgi:glycerophosphoryl diester phosphodiesterase
MAAYERAIDMGVNFIEPDLVITKDGQLVVRHDRYLSDSTNVADHPEFADRKTVKAGRDGADWFVEDFTLAEIKTLRAKQVKAGRPTEFDGLYEIPTFEDVLELVARRSEDTGRLIGIYPETKQPAALEALGLSYDTPMLDSLAQYGFDGEDDPVFIQSFEAENLRRLSQKTDIRLIYLFSQPVSLSMEEIGSFANGIGPYKLLLIDHHGVPTGLLKEAHDAGLPVHTWTFREDDVASQFQGNSKDELAHFMKLGVDGLFSDFPDTALKERAALE